MRRLNEIPWCQFSGCFSSVVFLFLYCFSPQQREADPCCHATLRCLASRCIQPMGGTRRTPGVGGREKPESSSLCTSVSTDRPPYVQLPLGDPNPGLRAPCSASGPSIPGSGPPADASLGATPFFWLEGSRWPQRSVHPSA